MIRAIGSHWVIPNLKSFDWKSQIISSKKVFGYRVQRELLKRCQRIGRFERQLAPPHF